MAVSPRESMRSRPDLKLFDVAGEIDIEVGVVVEVDDEDFVLRVGILDQRQRRGFHRLAFFPHAAAVIDHRGPWRPEDLRGGIL